MLRRAASWVLGNVAVPRISLFVLAWQAVPEGYGWLAVSYLCFGLAVVLWLRMVRAALGSSS